MQPFRTIIRTCAGISVLTLGFLLMKPAFPVAQEAPLPETASQPVSIVPAARDEEIGQRLERILGATGWFTGPRVQVRNGIVFLDGDTDSREHHDWAGKLAGNTEGVIAVVNRIAVDSSVASTVDRARGEFKDFIDAFYKALPFLALALFIAGITFGIAKLVTLLARRFFASRVSSPLLLGLVVRAFAIPVFLIGLYFVLQVAGLTRLALTVLGGTGLIGIILGFGLRDIAENFLASLLLSVRNPFHMGDLIEVAGFTGIVQNLNTRSTVLLTLDGNHVQIPNATVFKNAIVNYSSIPSRRAEFVVGIGYDSSTALAQTLITRVLQSHPAVLDQPEPLVLVSELGEATVNLRAYYWYNSSTYSPIKIHSALLRLSKNALLEGGIELPDPAREVIFPKGIPLVQQTENPQLPSKPAKEALAGTKEDGDSITTGEGDLKSDAAEVSKQSQGSVPEATENFLDPPPKGKAATS